MKVISIMQTGPRVWRIVTETLLLFGLVKVHTTWVGRCNRHTGYISWKDFRKGKKANKIIAMWLTTQLRHWEEVCGTGG